MSRTHRNIPHGRWFRRPRTYALRRDLIAAEEEIREELGPSYLAGNFAKISTIPTNRDDIHISARSEVTPVDIKYPELFGNNVYGGYPEDVNTWPYPSVMFDKQKNVFRAWRRYEARKQKVNYVPFVVTIARKQYPVKIMIEEWYD